ncbi:NADH-quinone oxidoreductase subunit NuoN [Fredinandcohnia quinoae]|uniref:NADH-quinone oxidoreductase subunit N n=1 Tax=Fredinandcohnia quinoae TaxID=2918902 RepID=A0AAW5DWY2_9BACI|nr:NADH-quinone oxidoreductase subunit NuoN [Fredinandcohnia sp. SECRCQ15]MCH1625157.1 NADH-quinone oxidoreductase subunit NuoN [Fredinandcohnia sp. SECRCQ15]
MDLDALFSYEWGAMAPEFIILGVATLLSLLDLFMGKDRDRKPLAWIGIAGIVIAIGFVVSMVGNDVTSILHDTFRLDSFAIAFKLILLVGTGMVLLLAMNYDPNDGIEYRGEFYYLILTALLGGMIMTSSGDLITLFVGLELLSISSYILAGLRKRNKLSNESAMKYVINGVLSTAIFLFGLSYVYGLTGTSNLKELLYAIAGITDKQQMYILAIAFIMIFIGLAFKIASAPFHMWAPDVYQGAPTPVTAFLGVVSKAAGFAIILRIIVTIFGQAPSGDGESGLLLFHLQDYLAFLAGATMIIGNTIALKQRNIKRLMAYSSIAHAGYLLVAFATLSYFMLDTVWFYLVAYLFMNLGFFAILQVLSDKSGSEDISQFAGLYKRSPLTAVALGIFILSLAGFPGTAGFIGKIKIFMGALMTPSHYVLASIMIATTVISYYYYFGMLTQIFFRPAADDSKIKLPIGVLIVIILGVVGTILFGILPGIALDFLQQFENFGDFIG